MKVKFNNRDPVYVQVIQHFKQQIAAGMMEPGQEVPSRRELAGRLKINPNTAQRAYKEMEDEGLIYTERNLPSKITRDEKVLGAVREELMLEAVENFITSVQSINAPLEEVVKLIQKKYKEKEASEGGSHD